MGKPSAPTPPDPVAVANAQYQTNEQTAQLQSTLNNVNQNSPYGNVRYSQQTPGSLQWTQDTSLSPAEQKIFDQSTAAQSGALGIANSQLGRVGSALGQNVTPGPIVSSPSFDTAQSQFDRGPPLATGFNPGQTVQGGVASAPVQTGFNQGQAVQGQVNAGPFDQSVKGAQDAAYGQATSRLDPQWQQAQEQQQAQLVAQGLSPNSQAYQTAMDNFARAKTDAYNQANYSAVQAGLAAQQQGYGQALQSGEFANTAAGQQFGQGLQGEQAYNAATAQQFGQGLQQGQFANTAAGQQYAQNQGLAGFQNAAAGQQYAQNQGAAQFYNTAEQQNTTNRLNTSQFMNQAQQQAFQQNAYAQELPINEFSALMGLGQVQAPTAQPYSPTNVSPTNVLGAYQLSSDVAQQNYAQQMGAYSSALGGMFSLGSAGIAKSDSRLKHDVHEVGQRGPFKLYVYKLEGEAGWREGVMAQEIQRLRPDCVLKDPDGWLLVDYERLAA